MQTWTENCYDASHIVNTDMSNIEINFATLKSAFSGIAAPAAIVAGQIYFNTSKNLHHFLNAAESDLLGLLPGDLSTKIWQYRNDATPGWVIDASVSDKVIALKGGSDAYDINGGSTGGTFDTEHTHTVSGHIHTSATHKHLTATGYKKYGDGEIATKVTPTGGSLEATVSVEYPASSNRAVAPVYFAYTDDATPGATGTSGAGATGTGGSTTIRPTAAVGTLQYPNVTQS